VLRHASAAAETVHVWVVLQQLSHSTLHCAGLVAVLRDKSGFGLVFCKPSTLCLLEGSLTTQLLALWQRSNVSTAAAVPVFASALSGAWLSACAA
jgi:hypothetical protein